MALTSAEKQQVEAAVDTFLESSNVQTGLANAIKSAEGAGVTVVDNIINNAKVGGLLGSVFTALKGSAEAEVNTLVASLPPAAIAMIATKGIENELKSILGA
jgi:hypothetical protein